MPHDEEARASLIGWLGSFAQAGRAALEASGFTVQTTRLATQPLELWLEPGEAATSTVGRLSQECARAKIDYCSLGTIQAALDHDERLLALLDMLPALLKSEESLFASVQVGARGRMEGEVGGINLDALRASARIIRRLASETKDGFGNLRFAAASNCPPHIPFFPASYYVEDQHNRGEPEFGLALEAAGLAVKAFSEAQTLEQARQNLLALLREQASKAAEACMAIGSEYGYTFTGLDISMAPYPDPDHSIARALEMLSGAPLGSSGSLSAAAFFTDILKEARKQLPTVGYSGLMLPAMEDQTLADRAGEGLVTIDTLLLLSAVCGLGLDTVPLPGDVAQEQLERIILDMAALAIKLDKPLTARLLPVPGKGPGEPAAWPDFPFFAQGRVMNLPGNGLAGQGLFSGNEMRLG